MAMLNNQRVCFISKWPVQDIVDMDSCDMCIDLGVSESGAPPHDNLKR